MENYDLIIRPKRNALDIDFKEIWHYRDLLSMFVKRDIITVYKQTVLGPIWFVLQPILTTAMFILVFGNIAKISTDGLPMMLFYLANIVIWNYFSECFNSTAKTFRDRQERKQFSQQKNWLLFMNAASKAKSACWPRPTI